MVIFLFLFLPFFLFSGEFRASVSQNEVGVGESFALTLTLIDASSHTSPSIEPLRKSFSIHSQQQSSNTVYNNGKLSSSTTWTYVLTSLQSGENSIPALTLETTEGLLSTQPIVMQIGKKSSLHTDITASAQISNPSPYKNEPFLLTLTLTAKQSLANVHPQKFELEGAIVEPAGEPVVYDKMDNGVRVGAIEFKYLITPLRAGSLCIPSIAIEGGIPQKKTRSRSSFFDEGFDLLSHFQGFESLKPFASATEPVEMTVASPVADINPWLPAKSLKIEEMWDEGQHLQEGEVFTRSFILEVEGVHSSQLPSLEELQADKSAFRVYADKPELKDEIKNGVLKSYRKEQYTFIPEKSGDLTLPEITVAWWDVINHKKVVSRIPSRTLHILPAAYPVVVQPQEKVVEKAPAPAQNSLLYGIIAALAILLSGAFFWLLVLQKKMARMLQKPAPSIHKKTPVPTVPKKRDKLHDLNPT